jgi:hypothetical protein
MKNTALPLYYTALGVSLAILAAVTVFEGSRTVTYGNDLKELRSELASIEGKKMQLHAELTSLRSLNAMHSFTQEQGFVPTKIARSTTVTNTVASR